MTEKEEQFAKSAIETMKSGVTLLPQADLEFFYQLFKEVFYILRDECDRRFEQGGK